MGEGHRDSPTGHDRALLQLQGGEGTPRQSEGSKLAHTFRRDTQTSKMRKLRFFQRGICEASEETSGYLDAEDKGRMGAETVTGDCGTGHGMYTTTQEEGARAGRLPLGQTGISLGDVRALSCDPHEVEICSSGRAGEMGSHCRSTRRLNKLTLP